MATRKAPPPKKPATKKAPAKKAPAKKAPAKKAVAKKAVARKPAAKRESVAARWAEGYRGFLEAVKERFAFLVPEQGFAEPTERVEPPDALVTFTKGDWFVRVATEYGGEPWVVVKAWEGEPYGLHVIIAEIDPAYAKEKPVPAGSTLSEDELRAMVAYWAKFLKEHASDVLDADPALVARFHARQTALQAARQ